MTTDKFNSEDPCAIATTLTPFLPIAPNNFAEIPGVLRMLSPMIARIAN